MYFETVKQLLDDPARTWGRSFHQTLAELVGFALAKATESSPLNPQDFASERDAIVKRLRAPTPTKED